jgi:hypothetical protein
MELEIKGSVLLLRENQVGNSEYFSFILKDETTIQCKSISSIERHDNVLLLTGKSKHEIKCKDKKEALLVIETITRGAKYQYWIERWCMCGFQTK